MIQSLEQNATVMLNILKWIVQQNACDKGTAIAIFHDGDPRYFEGFETLEKLERDGKYHAPTYELLMLISERWAAGAYTTYHFHPETSGITAPAVFPWHVPPDLWVPEIKGERLDYSGYSAEGYPPHLNQRGRWIGPNLPRVSE